MKKLFKFMPVHSPVLMMALLRLLHNLSFDSKAREDMVAIGFIPKLSEIMHSRRHAPQHLLIAPARPHSCLAEKFGFEPTLLVPETRSILLPISISIC